MGKQFAGKPYEAHTLDKPGKEHLVVNLRGFDCVTFIENVLAVSRCIKENRLTFDDYRRELQSLRYRRGVIDGYSSRLHYFTDWIADNERKGILKNVTKELGGTAIQKKLNFMTAHRASYAGLADDSAFARTSRVEERLDSSVLYYIPKSRIAEVQAGVHSGDIIAITTDIEGLDVSHTGIAIRTSDGSLLYLHAPNVHGQVQVTKETLEEHVKKFHSYTGIIVARPLDPPQ
ncbi:MAG TPA: N-acetylmuramoyl-L-alanine amidase-like domain-containing protein [Bacteroidota bacterium]|nr:N-acetylmuramoyl-L-alanine amidase-like domain-containing protein [Bacteroidota bacterium]